MFESQEYSCSGLREARSGGREAPAPKRLTRDPQWMLGPTEHLESCAGASPGHVEPVTNRLAQPSLPQKPMHIGGKKGSTGAADTAWDRPGITDLSCFRLHD